jgi:hypothetical protein
VDDNFPFLQAIGTQQLSQLQFQFAGITPVSDLEMRTGHCLMGLMHDHPTATDRRTVQMINLWQDRFLFDHSHLASSTVATFCTDAALVDRTAGMVGADGDATETLTGPDCEEIDGACAGLDEDLGAAGVENPSRRC